MKFKYMLNWIIFTLFLISRGGGVSSHDHQGETRGNDRKGNGDDSDGGDNAGNEWIKGGDDQDFTTLTITLLIVLRNSILGWYRLIASNYRDNKDPLLIRWLVIPVARRSVLTN
jgi:hypothetical protein